MNTKKVVTTILIAILTSMTISAIMPMRAKAGGVNLNYVTLSDAYMSDTAKWALRWGSGASLTITDIAGPGVQFDIDGLTTGTAAVADDYLVEIPGVGEDLTAYSGYELYLKNTGAVGLGAHLFMNTGHISGWPQNDTFWGGPWIWLSPGETKLYTLNFSNAEAWNANDDPITGWQVPGGTWTNVKRLNEVTKIGFELGNTVAYPADLLVVAMGSANPELYVDPSTVNKAPANNGTTFTVDIVIKNFTDFYGFDIKMTWDSSLLRYESAAYTDQLNTLWGNQWTEIPFHTDGSYKLAATKLGIGGNSSTGAYILFNLTLRIIKTCNFALQCAIHFDTVKLSDSDTPVPNSITPKSKTDGTYTMSFTAPDLELVYVGATNLEYCEIFAIRVYATHICANLKDYDLDFTYTSELLKFIQVSEWGVLGDNVTGFASYEELTLGSIHVWDTDTVPPVTGDSIFLFALQFHVEFDDRNEHIWSKASGQPAYDHMNIQISLIDAQLSFLEGTKTSPGEINMPAAIDKTVYFIRGDVDCNGKVEIWDISNGPGYYYDQTMPVKYDLNKDGTIDLYDIVIVATNYGYGT